MYEKSSKGWLKHFDFIVLDLICLQVAFILAYFIRHGNASLYSSLLYRVVSIFLVFGDIGVMFFHETFRNVLKRGYYREFVITVRHVVCVEALAVLVLYSVHESERYSRMVLYLTGILYGLISYIVRIIWKRHLKKKMAVGGKYRSLLIVTNSDIAADVVSCFKTRNYEMFHIAGVVLLDQDRTGEVIEGIPVVSGVEGAADYVCRAWIDEVFIRLAPGYPFPKEVVNRFVETGVILHMDLERLGLTFGERYMVERIGGYAVLTTSVNYVTSRQAFLKRACDIAGGLVGCALTAVIFLFVAPAIYINSPGPIFFSQIRVGKNGKKFKMYKFRSMYLDAEERKQELMKENRIKDGKMFKVDFDTRIIGNKILPDGRRKTGIGHFIRTASLDEFPQFFNVLKGDMSLIGTRPPTLDEFEQYESHHRARLAVRPGITGMWQVSGRSDITDFEEVVKLDLKYIMEWSLALDLKILVKTIQVVTKGEGAL